jgi:hypothetical protein
MLTSGRAGRQERREPLDTYQDQKVMFLGPMTPAKKDKKTPAD